MAGRSGHGVSLSLFDVQILESAYFPFSYPIPRPFPIPQPARAHQATQQVGIR